MLTDAAAEEAKKPKPAWKVQECFARDQFETCTLTIEQWLANTDSDTHRFTVGSKLQLLLDAYALALPGVESQEGLRQPPRVGYDPVGDQMIRAYPVAWKTSRLRKI